MTSIADQTNHQTRYNKLSHAWHSAPRQQIQALSCLSELLNVLNQSRGHNLLDSLAQDRFRPRSLVFADNSQAAAAHQFYVLLSPLTDELCSHLQLPLSWTGCRDDHVIHRMWACDHHLRSVTRSMDSLIEATPGSLLGGPSGNSVFQPHRRSEWYQV